MPANTVESMGYTNVTKIAKTIQGTVWKATPVCAEQQSSVDHVIKVIEKELHHQHIAHVHGQYYAVQEDVVSEARILEHITASPDCPASIVKFCGLSESKSHICLSMEYGGRSLFEFILKTHTLVKSGQIRWSHWFQVIRVIFKQMLEAIEYIHSRNICHFDVSLENFLINDVPMNVIEEDGKFKEAQFSLDDIQVKLCDFGLAGVLENGQRFSNKWVGKTNYKSPAVTNKKKFDPKKNDLWCLGVCLFTMAFGANPWTKAHAVCPYYHFIIAQGHGLSPVLHKWGMSQAADADLLRLLMTIFQPEHSRADLAQIKRSRWLSRQ